MNMQEKKTNKQGLMGSQDKLLEQSRLGCRWCADMTGITLSWREECQN